MLVGNDLRTLVEININGTIFTYVDDLELQLVNNEVSTLTFTIPTNYNIIAPEIFSEGDPVIYTRGFEITNNVLSRDISVSTEKTQRWIGKIKSISKEPPYIFECVDLLYDLYFKKPKQDEFSNTALINILNTLFIIGLQIPCDFTSVDPAFIYTDPIRTDIDYFHILKFILENHLGHNFTVKNGLLISSNPTSTGLPKVLDGDRIFSSDLRAPNNAQDIKVRVEVRDDMGAYDFKADFPTEITGSELYRTIYRINVTKTQADTMAREYYVAINNIKKEGSIVMLSQPDIFPGDTLLYGDDILFVSSVIETFDTPVLRQELVLSVL